MDIIPAITAIAECAKEPALLLRELYRDLAKPGVTQVGKALGTVLGLGNTVLLPLHLVNEKARISIEANLEKYRARMEKVELKDVVEVPPETGVPILEKLAYVTDEKIGDLFVELLAKASTLEQASLAHPSFVNIIANMSPDEALLLPLLQRETPFFEIRLFLSGRPGGIGVGPPYCVYAELLTGLESCAKLRFPDNIPAYLSNFAALGVVSIRPDLQSGPEDAYAKLGQAYAPLIQRARQATIPDGPVDRVEAARGIVQLTQLGLMFRQACTRAGDTARRA